MKKFALLLIFTILFTLFLVGCGSADTECPPLTAPIITGTSPPIADPTVIPQEICDDLSFSGRLPDKLNGILWMQTSSEYQIAAEQTYMLARVMLDRGLADNTWTAALEQTGNYAHLPPAVIVDVDETVLDNSPFQARLEKAGIGFDYEVWDKWVREMKAAAVPGAVEFLQYAYDEGVMVFYMTNRSYEHEEATRGNLEKLGFPLDDQIDTLLMNGEKEDWVSDKTNRRSFLADQYRIILLIGDVPNDFVIGTKGVSIEERNAELEGYHDYWGEKWILTPNPVYGDWEAALYDHDYGLSAEQKVERKLAWLDVVE